MTLDNDERYGERRQGTERQQSRDRRLRPDGGHDPAFFESVVERVGAGVGVYDDSGRYQYVNGAYAEMLEYDREELLGTPIWEINPEVDPDLFDSYWESFDIDETRRHETIHERADGTEIPVETVTTAIEVDGDRYNIGTIVEITERVEGYRRLERQNERLEQFASVVSHDLRNPLNVAVGRAELARTECDSPHIDAIQRSLDRMEELVEDVLTLARQGDIIEDPEPISLSVAASEAWRTISSEGATLTVEDELGTVASDESRLLAIFENLFSNAVIHAGPDVEITVGAFEDGFYVADDGPGIPDGDREDVFEYGHTTRREGTGFGLAIVKDVAEAHGWSVTLTDSDSGGARFEFHGVEFE